MANIVFYELEDSPFSLSIGDFKFYFSSLFYKDKFRKGYKDFIKCENLKLNVRYNGDIELNDMLLISLYKKIEKRGFRVFYKDKLLDEYSIKSYIDTSKEV